MLKRPIRWLVRIAVLLTLVSLLLFLMDLKYDFLPSSIQAHLLLHPDDPVVTDIEIRYCTFWSKCEDVLRDGKIKISKDLYLGQSWTKSAYLYISQVKETELKAQEKVVNSIAVGSFDLNSADSQIPRVVFEDILPTVPDSLHLTVPKEAYDVAIKNGWELRNEGGLGLWVKKGKHIPNQAVTNIKVLFGEGFDFHLPGWNMAEKAIPIADSATLAEYGPIIAFRIGRDMGKHVKNKVKFRKDGTFKIIQLADLHMSTGNGICYKPFSNASSCIADLRTNEFVEATLDLEKPDFVVFSGDQIMGSTSPDPETSLLKAMSPVLKRNIPWAMVWGNHDDEGSLNRQQLLSLVKDLPGSQINDLEGVSGNGNYVVTISGAQNDFPSLTMYFLDSHSYMPGKQRGYDYIKKDQLDMLGEQYGIVRDRLTGYPLIPLSMAFFHIPIPEYRQGTAEYQFGGLRREPVIGPMVDLGTINVLRNLSVSVVSVGHDHANDYCQFTPEPDAQGQLLGTKNPVWLCYGGGTGYGGYGGYPDADGNPYRRRIRVYEINRDVPSIDTWHRVEQSESIQNRVRLINDGDFNIPS